MNREARLAEEKMLPLMLRMSIPSIVAQLINLLYNIVDRIYIGHIPEVGPDALAGIGLTSSIIILISAFASFVSGGGAPLASIALGRGDRQKAEKILGNGVFLLILFSVVTTAAAYLFASPVLHLIGASEVTYPYATEYLYIYLTGTLFVQIAVGLNPFITCQGRSGIAMVSVLIGAVLNIILDPVFIFVFDMGVAGAALATVISQAISAVFVLAFLLSDGATLRIRPACIRPEKTAILPILQLGIAPFIMASTESFVGFVLNGNLQAYGGDLYVSALTVMQSAMQFTSVPLHGFTQGVTPIISYNFGRGNRRRVEEGFYISLAIMFTFNFVLTLLMILFPGFVAGIFTDDVALISLVEQVMPVFLAGMTIFGLQRACQFTFVALGQSGTSLFIALLRKVILLIPLAVILPRMFGLGVMGVYLAEAIADGTAAILCTVIFFCRFRGILDRGTALAARYPH